MIRWFLIFALCLPCFGQAWSGVLSTSRAVRWDQNAGLPATYPDSETTANPWTLPVRTQCGSTLTPLGGGTDDTAQINSAITACTAGHYVLLGGTVASPDTFTIKSTVTLNKSGVDLRSANGPMGTILSETTSGIIQIAGGAFGGSTCTVTSGLSQGSTSITMNGCGATPPASNLGWLTQCDTGISGNPCTGTPADNGSDFVCGLLLNCASEGGGGSLTHEFQYFWVSNVTNNGGGSYTLTVSPGIYALNWSTSNTALFSWNAASNLVSGTGISGVTLLFTPTDTQNNAVFMTYGYGNWIKGNRFVGLGGNFIWSAEGDKNGLIANNYMFGFYPSAPPNTDIVVAGQGNQDSDVLTQNNITYGGVWWEGEGENTGDVLGYNYACCGKVNGVWVPEYEHSGTPFYILHEGEDAVMAEEDDTHGTNLLSTYFRDYFRATDAPFISQNPSSGFAVNIANYARMNNIIGSVLGTSGATTNYQGAGPTVYTFGSTDSLALASTMRWDNYDTVTGGVRTCGNSSSPNWGAFCGGVSEIPTSITPNTYCTASASPYACCTGSGTGSCSASAYNNSIPASTTLPVTFYLPVASAHPNGGTGLSWWKVCKTWTTFPTACATSQTPPFPPIGPDVTGGTYASGFANDNAAGLAYQFLPIDTTLQSSFTVTGSSWSGGIETLTVSGISGTTNHFAGGFTVSGMNSACAIGANAQNGELLMTSSSTTTVQYALTSNPGVSCTGTLLWPDVRQFDERVYQADNASTAATPTCSANCAGTYTGSVVVTFANSNGGTTVMCGAVSPTTPVTNGSGTGCSTGTNIGTGAAANVTISSSETYNVVAGTSLLADSSVLSEAYTINAATGPIMNGAFKLTGGKLN